MNCKAVAYPRTFDMGGGASAVLPVVPLLGLLKYIVEKLLTKNIKCFSWQALRTYRGVYPPTTKVLFPHQLPPFPPLVFSSPSFPSCREAAPLKPARGPLRGRRAMEGRGGKDCWNQLGGKGERCKLPSGVCGEAPTNIDFGVFWVRKKTHLTAIIVRIFVYWNLLNF